MSLPDPPHSSSSSEQSSVVEVPQSQLAAMELGAEQIAGGVLISEASQPKLRKRYLVAIYVAVFTLYAAWIAPGTFSLAIRIQDLDAASKNTALSLTIGIPAVLVIFLNPLIGVLSDRTRTKIGRRRPWLLGGIIAGLLGSALLGVAPSVPALAACWTVAYLGYTVGGAMILVHLGDRLPESQRGKVSGISGALTGVAPVFGVVAAGALVKMPIAMFLVPAAIAFVGGMIFVIVMQDEAITTRPLPLSIKPILQGFYFNPREHRNFAWVWLSRALVFVALSIPAFTVYLLAARLHLGPAAIAGLVGLAGIASVLTSILGALGAGFLSDRLKSRKPFLGVSAVLLAVGLVTTGTITGVPQYVIGSLMISFSIGAYAAVDQAMALDVLPKEEGQNGRFLAIYNLANQVPQAVGPLLGGLVVTLAGGDYAWVYFVGAAAGVIGALAILPVRIVRSAKSDTVAAEATPV